MSAEQPHLTPGPSDVTTASPVEPVGLTDAEWIGHCPKPTRSHLLELAELITGPMKDRYPNRTPEEWLDAAGCIGDGGPSAHETLLLWSLGGDGPHTLKRVADGWLFQAANGRLYVTTGTRPRLRFNDERRDYWAARCTDRLGFLWAAIYHRRQFPDL